MKRVITIISTLFIFITCFAQPPHGFNYQAVVRDAEGVIIANQEVHFRLSILNGSMIGEILYQEVHMVPTNEFGLANILIGGGTPISGIFADINWRFEAKFLKVEIDPEGGEDWQYMGSKELMSVPFALYAASDWIKSGTNLFYPEGYVGIGADNPGAGLDIEGSAGYASAVALNNTGGGLEWRMTSWTDGTFRLVKTTGTTFSALVVEPVNGNIGIGTSGGDMNLNVHSSSGISYIRVSDNTSGPTSGLRMGCSGSGNAYIINDEPLKSLSLGTDGTTQVRITDIGRVGINELTPDMMLHIKQDAANKSIRHEHQSTTDYWENGVGTTTLNYKFYFNNLFRADISSVDGAYVNSSDRRLKKDVNYMEPVLSKVSQLKPATYQYVDNDVSEIRSTGFIAQEVEELFPDLVRESDDGYKGLIYDGFAVISIKAIQELNDKITQLEQEVEELRQKIEQ